jgi:hypothetical protein
MLCRHTAVVNRQVGQRQPAPSAGRNHRKAENLLEVVEVSVVIVVSTTTTADVYRIRPALMLSGFRPP